MTRTQTTIEPHTSILYYNILDNSGVIHKREKITEASLILEHTPMTVSLQFNDLLLSKEKRYNEVLLQEGYST